MCVETDRRKRTRSATLASVAAMKQAQQQPRKRTKRAQDPAVVAEESNIPRGFLCPLTMEVMFEPVLDAEGNTYERAALFQWLEQNPTSPISRQPLNQRMVVSNNALRETIHEFMGDSWVLQKSAEKENQPQLGNTAMVAPSAAVIAAVANAGKVPSRLRSKIDCFLQNTCNELGGLDLKLNSDGCCAFRYDTITIVLDVPETIGVFCLYTKDLLQGFNNVDQDRLYRRAMELNFLQGDTRGGCLSVRSHAGRKEVMFSYTDRVPEVSARDFSNILLNFVETAVALRDKLMQGIEQAPQWWEDEAVDEEVVDLCDKADEGLLAHMVQNAAA